MDRGEGTSYFRQMSAGSTSPPPTRLVAQWPLSSAATLGSAVRAKGILLEARARIGFPMRNYLQLETGEIVMRVPEDSEDVAPDIIEAVTQTVGASESLPVIPREVEDILTITTAERHRWQKDNRLISAGTRTVKLRGRARKITFHVFDPRQIEDVLDRDLVTIWRDDDARVSADNRRRAAAKAALVRAGKRARAATPSGKGRPAGDGSPGLKGWDEFDLDGLLR